MKTARQIAELFGNDGQAWTDSDGHEIDDICEARGGKRSRRDGYGGDTYRWDFGDGSSIIMSGASWGFGYPERDCWTATTECAYCGADVADYGVHASDDDVAWTIEASQHRDDCEWVSTRAHQRD